MLGSKKVAVSFNVECRMIGKAMSYLTAKSYYRIWPVMSDPFYIPGIKFYLIGMVT